MKKKRYQNKRVLKLMAIVITLLLITTISSGISISTSESVLKQSNNVSAKLAFLETEESESRDFVYLSDLDYITANNWSYNGWSGHEIQKDKNPEGNPIYVNIDGKKKLYLKGMGIHAKGQLTYDISTLSKEYSRFTALVGVDASRTASSDLGITVSVSDDGNAWTNLFKRDHIRAGDEASKVDVDISNHTFLRIYVDPHGSNTADHGVIANAKLAKTDYDETKDTSSNYDKVHPLGYYDEILNAQTVEYNRENNYRLVLEREVVNKIGYEEIQAVVGVYPKTKETLDWIFNASDNSVLQDCISVGELKSGISFLNILTSLYEDNKQSLETINGYVIQKMMISMAASYTTDAIYTPLRFGAQYASYDAVERFRLMKSLLDNNKFYNTNQFKRLPIELMRLVTNDGMRNDEYTWLNGYSKLKGADIFQYRVYMNYVDSASYNQDKFFNPIYETSYSNMYKLKTYGVPYGDERTLRYWMVMDTGGICWNISRMAQSVARVNGIPSTGIYSPVHEPYLFYTENSNGKGIWEIRNKVGSWGVTGTTWGGGSRYRLPMDWANKYFTDQNISGPKGGTSSGYVVLAQANLNDYENYTKSVWYNLLANSYEDNQNKLVSYNKSLEVEPINLDTYDSLINLYVGMGSEATNATWVELANKIIDNYTFFPPASYDLIKVVNPHISNIEDRLAMDQKLLDSLKRANKATDRDTLQKAAVQEISAVLLGKTKVDLASFSFDGETAGKIVVDEAYKSYDFQLYYSLDGGKTYSEPTPSHEIQLSEEEVLSITPTNDILLKMLGTDAVYTIDIVENSWPTAVYGNDLENRIVDSNLDMEWRLKDEDGSWPSVWTSYVDASPDLTGNKTVQVRMRSMGNKKFNNYSEFTFTQDNQRDNRRYIPVSHLSISGAGSEINPAVYAINGNFNNYWRSGSESNQKYIVVRFDKPIYLSAVEFIPGPTNGNDGRFTKATIYNGANSNQKYQPWSNFTYTTNDNSVSDALKDKQVFDVSSTFTQKISSVRITFSSASSSINLRGINFYQDLTKEPRPTAGIGYSTTEPTNKEVVARLINKSSDTVRITNNDGSDTYTFKENGSFTFEFIDDATGKTGSATATVNWIDRTAPTATIEYDVTTSTSGSVFATLKPSEDVIVTSIDKYRENEDGKVIDISGNVLEDLTIDEGGYVKDASGNTVGNVSPFLHIFRQNDSYTFEFEDKAGNKGQATATVDWIDQTAPEATVFYDITQKTNKSVTAHLEFDKENVTVLNNGGSSSYTFDENGEFTFEFKDQAGNIGTKKVAVTWIDKVPPSVTLKYSTKKKTNGQVTVTLTDPSEEITILNNDGKDSYTFDDNGTFTFEIADSLGNKASIEAEVSWIDKEAPTAEIEYSTTKKTNQSVTATLTNTSEEIEVVNNEGKGSYTFDENGKFTFIIEDEVGNRSEVEASVDWIDKIAPTADIEYSTKEETEGPVEVTLTLLEEDVKVVNNDGKMSHTFDKNGEFIFIIEDEAGNRSEVIATVSWIIDKVLDESLASDVYKIIEQKVSQIPAGTTFGQFKNNVRVKREITLKDRNDLVLDDESDIATGMKAIVGKKTYTLIVPGDIDGNAKITITDLAKMCLHYIEDELLEGVYKDAADLDGNDKITLTDLAKLQLVLLEINDKE